MSRFFAHGPIPAIATLLLFITAAALSPTALNMRIDNRLERWIDEESDAARDYEQFKETFGSDEFVVVAYGGDDLFGERALDVQLSVLDALESIAGVSGVLGVPAVYRDVFGSEDPEALRDEFSTTPFYKNFLVGEDDAVAGLLIETEAPGKMGGRRKLMDGIYKAIEPLEEQGWIVHVVGSPALNVVLDEISASEGRRTLPLAGVLSVLTLLYLFRSWRACAVALICAGLTVMLTVGAMGVADRPLNMVTTALPALLWVLALANVIHILRRYQEHRHTTATLNEALERALGEVASPCALSSVTTAAGFLSLLVSSMAPVREFGMFAAAGLIIALVVNLTVGPCLIAMLNVPPTRRTSSRWISRLHEFTLQRTNAILVVSVLLTVAACLSITGIRVESDPLDFLPADSTTTQAYAYVGDNLTGFYSLEVVIRTPEGWLQSTAWPLLDGAARELEAMGGVARVLTPLDLLRKLKQWDHDFEAEFYVLPKNGREATLLLEEVDEGTEAALDRLVASDGKSVRLSVLVRVMDSDNFLEIARKADEIVDALNAPFSGYTSGIIPRLVHAQLKLVDTQIRSFALAFCIVFVFISVGLKSLPLMAASILPNVLPVLSALAGMSLAGISLDAGTVMVASIALGIAVDDTVHVLSAYRSCRVQGNSPAQSTLGALERVGPAITITTATACIGFFALGRSAFIPIRYFGIFAGIAMLVALIADLVLVPAILIRGERMRTQKETS